MPIRMSEANRAMYMEDSTSGKLIPHYQVTPLKISKEHLDYPDRFCNEDLPEESTIRFGEDRVGRIICPISLDELKERSTCYKVDCCKMVFLQKPLKEWLKRHSSCPLCSSHLITKKILPNKNLIIVIKKSFLFIVAYYCLLVSTWYMQGKPESWLIDKTFKSLF